jgi:glycosyltransferase involved in cell wall biosynthesis
MDKRLLISVITPARNAEKLITETVLSLISQIGLGRDFDIEYLLIDGASDDKTVELVCELVNQTQGFNFHFISESDKGMYDALAKGLRLSTGEIVCYLNAGDYYSLGAFNTVVKVFKAKHAVWITGLKGSYNEDGSLVGVSLPTRLSKSLNESGFYGGRSPNLGFIQQEVTFWRRSAMDDVDLAKLSTFKLSGDAYLWRCFFEIEDPLIVSAVLGGHRTHVGQLSEDIEAYKQELKSYQISPSVPVIFSALSEKFISWLPSRLRRLWMKRQLTEWSVVEKKWS